VLNERERQVLARIEHHLVITDPEFTQLFHTAARRTAGSTPRTLLAIGLALLVIGAAVTAVPVAVFGMLLAMVALVAAYQRNGLAGFSAA